MDNEIEIYLYILHRTDYGSFSESSPWVGWLVIFRNGTESTWTMDCKALTKQPLCEMYKYILSEKYIYTFYTGLTVSSAKAETGDKLVTCQELC